MRIISGTRRGHKLLEFKGDNVRPTTDRVKESIFNIIQFYLKGANVLDLFAGSGALAFEAVSRGAQSAVLTDADGRSLDVIRRNLNSLRFENVQVLQADAFAYLKQCRESFDIIFLDPPYNQGFVEPVLKSIAENNVLKETGIIVLETDHTDEPGTIPSTFSIKTRKKYGRTVITVLEFKKVQENNK